MMVEQTLPSHLLLISKLWLVSLRNNTLLNEMSAICVLPENGRFKKSVCVCIKFYFKVATTATEAFQMVKFYLARKQETELKHLIAFRVQK
jgi:hypothetical protein